MNRRRFIEKTAIGSAAVTVAGLMRTSRASTEKIEMTHAILGRTGQRVSRLGVGCGIFITREYSSQEIAAMVETAIEHGVNYIDTAPNYPGVQEKLGPILKDVRDDLFLVSKIEEPTYDGAWRQLKKSMRDMQTDRLDLVFFHSFGDANRWPDIASILGKNGALTALLEAKQQGVIGAIGASGHNNPSRYHALLDTGEIDVLMNVVNFAMQHTYGFETKVWPRAREMNMGLVAMKVLGGVHPTTQKDFRFNINDYDNAIRYALSIPDVATAVIGMRDPFEVDEAAAVVKNFQPLSKNENLHLSKQGQQIVTDLPSVWREVWGKEN